MKTDQIQQIASMLTDDPNILTEIAGNFSDQGPRVRNLGTTALRGNVATTGKRYSNALEKQTAGGVDPKKLVKEIQTAIVNAAKLLAKDQNALEEFLKLTKQTVNTDLLKIAAYYRKQGGENESEEQPV